MGVLGKKLRGLEGGRVAFMCPGCNEMHQVGVGEGAAPRWGYNGNPDAPTFTPSVLVRATRRITDDERQLIMNGHEVRPDPTCCHSFVRDGLIQFLSDCTHALAGQTVDLPEIGGAA